MLSLICKFFPLSTLHPNVGSRLCEEILLLSADLAPVNSTCEGEHIDDYMQFVPRTNPPQQPQEPGTAHNSTAIEITEDNAQCIFSTAA
jgi:hypothetical protein